MPRSSDEWLAYFDAVSAREETLMRSGIPLNAPASMHIEQLKWATGVNLVVPMEVRTKEDVRALAKLAKRHLRQQAVIAGEFAGYVYGLAEWRAETPLGK